MDNVLVQVDNLTKRYGTQLAVANISFEVHHGEHLTLLGPSGCGKTTTLRCIAGLERPDAGDILIDGRLVFSSKKGANVPAEKRGLSMVFQSYALWPHMTVFENVAYGLKARKQKLSKDEIRKRVQDALELVELEGLEGRPTPALSGGQQQRVALARSFVLQPKLLLFDEPLSNLDAKLRAEMRVKLTELLQRLGITSIYVTHDQEEAMALSDRIIVMNAGNIEQIAPPTEVYNRPISRFVADFLGATNIFAGKILLDKSDNSRITVQTQNGHLIICGVPNDGRIYKGRTDKLNPQEVAVAIRPVYFDLYRQNSDKAAQAGVPACGPAYGDEVENIWEGEITASLFIGDYIQYHVRWGETEVAIHQSPEDIFGVGEKIYFHADPKSCILLTGHQ